MGCIYLLYNEEGRGYIGQTTNIKKRLKEHKNKKEMSNSKLLGVWKCEILEEVDDDCLADYERYYYDMYNEMFPNMLVNKKIPLLTKKESSNKWKEANKEYYKEIQKDWCKKNPEKIKEAKKRFRAKKREQLIST